MSPLLSFVFKEGFDSVMPLRVQAMTDAPVRGRIERSANVFPTAGDSSSIRQVSTSASVNVPPRRWCASYGSSLRRSSA